MSDAKPLTEQETIDNLLARSKDDLASQMIVGSEVRWLISRIDALRARAEQAEADASWWKELGTRLWSSAAEQQHTLASLGWDDSDSRIGLWSKAALVTTSTKRSNPRLETLEQH